MKQIEDIFLLEQWEKVREDPILKKYCEKCDSRGGVEAVRENRPYIYQCCFGLIDVAIPIVISEIRRGICNRIGQSEKKKGDMWTYVGYRLLLFREKT